MALTGSLPFAASAQIVPTPGTSTHVIETQNGLPQVNVASPSGAGVSVNTYNQFDVRRPGAILNNSSTIVNTQQAGMINGNPNFGPNQAAQIIVNQVNSAAASQIGGYIEIAGNRAQFVLANPAGIVVDGGGFINTSRATLTTGQPLYGVDGSLTGYNVSRGLVTVQGAGLNASNIDQVDLISRALEANAAIHAKDLNVVTGANQVHHDTLATALITGDGPAPGVSIDVGRLGGMYANRILLVGTERGVGVSNAGVLSAQAGNLTLRSNGQLTLSGETNAKGELAFAGHDGVVNSGTTYSQQGVSVQTSGNLVNSGVLAAQQNLDVIAGSVNSTGTLGAGVNQHGEVTHGGHLTVSASGQVSATGHNVAGGDGALQGGTLNLEGSRTAANGDLTLLAREGDVLLAKAQTSARGTLKASAAGALTNDDALMSGQEGVTLTTGKLSNRSGKIAAPGPIGLQSSEQFDNQKGALVSDGAVTVRAGAIGNNEGTIQSAGAMAITGESLDNTAGTIASLNSDGLSVTATGQLINAAGASTAAIPGGRIGGNGSAIVQAGTLNNQGDITAKTDLEVVSQSLDNRRGKLAAGRNATVTVGENLLNDSGRIAAGQAAVVKAASLDNSGGSLDADRLTLGAKTLANRDGTITQTGTGPINVAVADSFDNTSGTLHTNSVDLSLAPASLINDHGKIAHAGNGVLRVRSGALSNQGGSIATNGAIDLNAMTLSNQAGTLRAQRQATLTVHSLDNRLGAYIGADSLSLNAAGRADNGGGTIEAIDGLTVVADSLANAAGAIKNIGKSALSVTSTKALENTEGGTIGGNGDVIVHAGTLSNQGSITAKTDLDVASRSLDNSQGKLTAGRHATVNVGENLVNGSGRITAGQGATVNAALMDNRRGTLVAGQNATLKVGESLINDSGKIAAGQAATVNAASLDNSSGSIGANELTLGATNLTNRGGKIAAPGPLILQSSGPFDNRKGTLLSDATVTVRAGAIGNMAGTIQSAGAMALTGASLDNTAGTIASLSGDGLSVTATGPIINAAGASTAVKPGGTIGGNGDVIVQAGALSNQGNFTAKTDLQVASQSLDNRRGTLAAGRNATVTVGAGLINDAGRITAAHAATVNAASLDNSGGAIDADQLTLGAKTLANRGGTFTQTGTGPIGVVVEHTFDNTRGTLQTNSIDLSLAPAALINDYGKIAHAGSGSLQVRSGALSNHDGSIATNGALDLKAAALSNQAGTMTAQRQATLAVHSLDNRLGAYLGADSLSLNVTGRADNGGGVIEASNGLTVAADSVGNVAGTIKNIGTSTLRISSAKALDNSEGGTVGGNGAVDVAAGSVDNTAGSLLSSDALTLQSNGTLTNARGLIQAKAHLHVEAQGAVSNVGGQIEANGKKSGLTLRGRGVDNTDGRVANIGTGSTTIDGGPSITNTNVSGKLGAGTIGGNGDVILAGRTQTNTRGGQILAGRDLTLDVNDRLDNTTGVLSASRHATLNGANATMVNRSGSLRAEGVLSLDAASIDNTSGNIGNAGGGEGSIRIAAGTLGNQGGAIGSDRDLTVSAGTLSGDGSIVAGRRGEVALGSDYTQTVANRIHANGDLIFTTRGRFTNQGVLDANGALRVHAANVDNAAGARLNATSTTVDAGGGTIDNAGRIEGSAVATTSATLNNMATIVGRNVSIHADSINNAGAAAVIASAKQADLYASNRLVNTRGATIFSVGDINIAANGQRGADGLLVNRVPSVLNDQSILEAGGNIEMAAHTFTNARPAPTVVTEMAGIETKRETKRAKYIGCPTGNAAPNHGVCSHSTWSGPYKTVQTATYPSGEIISRSNGANAVDRVLVVNVDGQAQTIHYNTLTDNGNGTVTANYWDGYDPHINYDPASEYPTRDDAHKGYQRVEIARDITSTIQQDKVTHQMQPARMVAGGNILMKHVGTLNNQHSTISAGNAIRIGDSHASGSAGSGEPGGPPRMPFEGASVNNVGQTLYRHMKQDIVSTYAWNEDIHRDVGTIVAPSIVHAPVAIGGTGGTIIANQSLVIDARDVNNQNVAAMNSTTGATGGTLGANRESTHVAGGVRSRVSAASGEIPVDNTVGGAAGATMENPLETTAGKAVETTLGTAVASRVGTAEGNPATATVGTTVPAMQSVASATGALPDLALPVSGLFTIHPAPAQPYLVVTDSRLTSYTQFTSSDYMLGQLGLDPQSIQKRLGDGMFEQQTVRNQVTQLTGRTFLPGYASAEDAYRALMTNGVNVARQFGLTPGIALSAAQMDALTSDIVWLVEQNVALADGSTTRVLAPVVYLSKTRANDLLTTGALIAGDTVEVHATGSVKNSGVIKGGRSTVVSATDILNRGGTIASSGAHGDANRDASGDVAGTTIVSATRDVLNTSGRITGNRVAVLAGRDIVNTTLADADGVAGASGVSKMTTSLIGQQGEIASTGDLALRAGRDLMIHGASLSAGEDALILAGRDITVDTVESATNQSMHLNDQRHWEESSTTHVSSGIGVGGDLVMQSGNDTMLKGASIAAGQDLAVIAGGNLTATTVLNEHRLDNVATDDRSRKEVSHTYDQRALGTTLQAGRNVALGAGSPVVAADAGKGNVMLTGSSVTSGTDTLTPGGITIAATHDVTVNEGREQHDSYRQVQSQRGGFLSSTTIDESHDKRTNTSVASTVSGDTVRIQAGESLAIQGSNVVGTNDVGLVAGRDVTIGTSQDKTDTASRYEKNEAGLLSGGGWAVTIGSRSLEQTEESQTVKNNASVIGSSQGSVAIGAERDVTLSGAQVVAGRDIGIVGRNVTVAAAADLYDAQRTRRTEQAGVTVGLGGGLVQVAKAISGAVKAGADSGDARLAAVQGVAAAEIAHQNRGAIQNAAAAIADGANPAAAGGVQLQISIGASHSEDASTTAVSAARGSSIIGSGDVAIVATGEDGSGARQAGVGDLTMVGAKVLGKNVSLEANNNVTLKSAQHTQRDTSSNSSGGASAGVGIGFGQGGAGISIFAGVSAAHGSGNGQSVTQSDTTVRRERP